MIHWNERSFITSLYVNVLGRIPSEGELQHYVEILLENRSSAETASLILESFLKSPEHLMKLRSVRRELRSDETTIVFVANDAVYKQTLPFLESITHNSPGIRMVCIPYADDLCLTEELAQIYGFSFHTQYDIRDIQLLAKDVYGNEINRLRKIAAFTVDAREFLSLDVDMIVLKDLRPLFGYIGEECDVVHTDISPGGTYKNISSELLAHTREINTGAYLSSRTIFDQRQLVSAVREHSELFLDVCILQNDDQCFMSFPFDVLRKRYRNFEELGIPYSSRIWYLHRDFEVRDGEIFDKLVGKPVAMIHYAGVGNGDIANGPAFGDLYNHYLLEGRKRVKEFRKRMGKEATPRCKSDVL